MSHAVDPPRLLDPRSDASAAVRAVLDQGGGGLPDARQLARLARRLPLGAPPPGGGAPSARPSLAPAAPTALLGPAVGLAIAVAAIAAALLYNPAATPVAPPVTTAPVTAPEPVPPEPAATVAARPRATLPEGPRVAPPEDPATRVQAARPAAAPAPPASPSTSSSAPSAEGAGEREVELLQRAHAAVDADPARALSLVREHEQRFPRGSLAEEREVIAVRALVGLGRVSEARARALRLLASSPSSAYRRRLEKVVPGLSAGDGGTP